MTIKFQAYENWIKETVLRNIPRGTPWLCELRKHQRERRNKERQMERLAFLQGQDWRERLDKIVVRHLLTEGGAGE